MPVTDHYWAKSGQKPTSAPSHIRLSDGTLRTDPSTFTESEMQEAGYTIKASPPPSAEPWQRVVWDGANSQWTTPDRDLATVQAERIEQLRAVRNEAIQSDASHTFSDGTAATIPSALPYEAVRMQGLLWRAERLVRNGNGDTTLQFEDVTGQDIAQPASEVVEAGDTTIKHAQDWHEAFVGHKHNVLATTTAKDAYQYDPANNGGWPG